MPRPERSRSSACVRYLTEVVVPARGHVILGIGIVVNRKAEQFGLASGYARLMNQEPISPPLVLSFGGSPVEHDPDVRDAEEIVDGVRWAIVEYAPGAGRSQWCDSPHSGYLVSGELEYEFEDGSPAMRVAAQQAFRLPAAPAHRGRNHGDEPARLFIIDALPAAP